MAAVQRGHRPWLLRAPSAEYSARLFCFPYSGCGASMYRRWPRGIDRAEVCPIQLPARENRIAEPHYGTFEALAEAMASALRPFFDVPFAFFGHCAGALQAYELARFLERRGGAFPAHVFLSSQPPPHDGAPPSRFSEMSEADLRTELRALAVAMGGAPTDELLDHSLAIYRPDLEAARSYRKEAVEPLSAPVTVIAWSDGQPPELLEAWRAYGDVTITLMQGGHYDFLGAPPSLLGLLSGRWPAMAGG